MRNGIIETAEDMQKIKQIELLQKKLDIAVKALEEIERESDKFNNSMSVIEQLDYIKADCQAALYHLREIEED